ncbi:rhoptry neck protein 6, putative [Plasmodium chabaudi chabaudi]|uniref:Rhoptry neck protein 6, putative n=1 Tax=Plasmodium chabaudi chabaudi TaxID=31271 RepID=A0A1C6X3M4_PLACU|nr:rhoptry neck protein 6, putative [Plasmodium chabaudi chabaudi]
MHYYFFLLFALCANGLLRNKGSANFVSNNDEAIGNWKDMDAFGMSQNGTLYLNSDSNLNETSSESFLENCNINSCVDISHENSNPINNQQIDHPNNTNHNSNHNNDHSNDNNNNNLKVGQPNGINNNLLKAEINKQNLSNTLDGNATHVNSVNTTMEKNENLKKNTEGAINIMHTPKENLQNVKKNEIKSNNKNKDNNSADDEIDDEKDDENLDSSVEDEYKDSEDDDLDEDKEDDENENENEQSNKKVAADNNKGTEISASNNAKETEPTLGKNAEKTVAISEAGSNHQAPKFQIHNEKDKIKTINERFENGNKPINEFDITNDNKMGNTSSREVGNEVNNALGRSNIQKNFHEIQNNPNGSQHGAKLQGEKVENKMLGDKKLDDEKLDDEELDDEKLDDEKLDDEKLDDEKLDDEKLDDDDLDEEKLDGKKKKKNVEDDDSEMDQENDEEDEGDEDEPIVDDSIENKEKNNENKNSISKEIKNMNESTKNEQVTDANQKTVLNEDNKNYNETDANCSKIVSDKVENTILQTTKIDQDIHEVKEREENTKPSLNASENHDPKPEQNYESNMFTIDKKMHNKLNNIDGILRGLNDKLRHHKDLKNLELKLKFEAMGRIEKYKMYNEVIQKAIETLTKRLAKVNDDLNKLKEVSSISLQKYMNETGYGLESLNFPQSDLDPKKEKTKTTA